MDFLSISVILLHFRKKRAIYWTFRPRVVFFLKLHLNFTRNQQSWPHHCKTCPSQAPRTICHIFRCRTSFLMMLFQFPGKMRHFQLRSHPPPGVELGFANFPISSVASRRSSGEFIPIFVKKESPANYMENYGKKKWEFQHFLSI